MLRNYISIAYRSLLKNKAFSFINIFGLAIGMASFLFILQYIRFERSYEDFNTNVDNVYRLSLDIYNGSEYVVTDSETHPGIGPLLKERMPEVKGFVRLYGNDGLRTIKVGTSKFLEDGIYFADPSAFTVFTYSFLQGDPAKALTAPFEAVLTETVAKKYFGRTNVIDESIEIEQSTYRVKAVIEDVPANTHLKFTILLSRSSFATIKAWYKEDNWGNNNEYTYLLMWPGTNLAAFNEKLKALSAELDEKLSDVRYVAEPIKDIHLYSNKSYEPEANGSAKVVYYLMIIAVFIIIIAWVNYVNLSTARAMERAREVGIRKVMGSLKVQLVLQFLSESVIVNIVAGVIAFGVFQAGMPFFRELTGQPLFLDLTADPVFWYFVGGLVGVGSLLSGIYPAFVLASFQPVLVLKGKFRSSAHGQLLRKGLVIFQFGTSVALIICMVTVYRQVNYLQNYDLGMNIDQTVVVNAPQLDAADSVVRSAFQSFKTELLNNPKVRQVGQSESVPGVNHQEVSTTSFTRVGDTGGKTGYTYYFFYADDGFIPTLDMKLIAGRNFESGVANEDRVIINEQAVWSLGFSTPEAAIGSKVTFRTRGESQSSTIIGVLGNFYHRSPKEEHIPMLFYYAEDAEYFSIRLKTDNVKDAMAEVKRTWDTVFPGSVFNYFFLDEKYNQQYKADAQFGRVMATFSGLLVFIACLGLFGLSSYTIVQRTKEIGIRKILGASVVQIVQLLSRDFVKVILLASLCALPAAYFAMENWLSNYAVRIHFTAWIFVVPVIVILLIALLTVSFQTIKTALSNPANALKQE